MRDRRSYARNLKQFPVGLIAQLVEHCTGIAEVMGLPRSSLIFFPGFLFAAAKAA